MTCCGRTKPAKKHDIFTQVLRDQGVNVHHFADLFAKTALIFEKASTRTMCAFEVAAFDQGAHVTYLGPSGSHIGNSECIADTARALGRMFDGIEFRGFAQDSVEQLADYAGIPVWNGLTTDWHPTHMLADSLTMTEHHYRPLEEIAYCFLGDGRNNVARSLLITGALPGMDVRIAAPLELWPPDAIISAAQGLAIDSGVRAPVTDDAARGVEGVDFVYPDVWGSMDESDDDWATRVPEILSYRVTEALMNSTGRGDTKFLNCVPALHNTDTELGRRLLEQFGLDGAEVSNDVFKSPASRGVRSGREPVAYAQGRHGQRLRAGLMCASS